MSFSRKVASYNRAAAVSNARRSSRPRRPAYIRLSYHLARFHDEPVRRGAHVSEGIACHQRQLARVARIQHTDVVGFDNFHSFDPIGVAASACLKEDQVVFVNLTQAPEYGIPMAGDTDVSRLSR